MRRLAVPALVLLVLAGCGGGDDGLSREDVGAPEGAVEHETSIGPVWSDGATLYLTLEDCDQATDEFLANLVPVSEIDGNFDGWGYFCTDP